MTKPYIICHMMSTVDGRILTADWRDENLTRTFSGVFEKYHDQFESQAWLCGRVTMEKDFANGVDPVLTKAVQPIARTAFIGNENAKSFAIAVDAKGKLDWDSNETGGDHIIEILTEQVSDDYLHYLRQKSISYIFAGKEQIDFSSALEQLKALFPIETIMLEGGGHLNGSLLNDGLIDELSLMLLPIADGTTQSPSLFEVSDFLTKAPAKRLYLKEMTRVDNDVLWLRYQFQATV